MPTAVACDGVGRFGCLPRLCTVLPAPAAAHDSPCGAACGMGTAQYVQRDASRRVRIVVCAVVFCVFVFEPRDAFYRCPICAFLGVLAPSLRCGTAPSESLSLASASTLYPISPLSLPLSLSLSLSLSPSLYLSFYLSLALLDRTVQRFLRPNHHARVPRPGRPRSPPQAHSTCRRRPTSVEGAY